MKLLSKTIFPLIRFLIAFFARIYDAIHAFINLSILFFAGIYDLFAKLLLFFKEYLKWMFSFSDFFANNTAPVQEKKQQAAATMEKKTRATA